MNSTTLMKAAVVAVLAAALFATATGFCGCGRANDQANFRRSVRTVLDDVVKRTPGQVKNPASGDTIFTTTSDPRGNLGGGAVAATGTCFKGGPTECSACLRDIRGFLKRCEGSGCGGGLHAGDCQLQFRLIK
ncbi:unnamed protein product [Linum trigynum]|uniref:Gnk2-homologous domain-containing protein n=1 Tax=Linum trigynum TaxID=586398 RepID=A0AAV2EIM4_9ROSI